MRRLKILPLFIITISSLYMIAAYIYHISLLEIFAFLCLLWTLPSSIALGNKLAQKEVGRIGHELARKEKSYNILRANLEKLKPEKIYLERKMVDTSRLYTVTKNMSSAIELEELLGVLRDFLIDNFRFSRFTIGIMNKNKKYHFDRFFILDDNIENKEIPDKLILEAAQKAVKSRLPLFIDAEEKIASDGGLEERKNILVIPLFVASEVIAFIAVEDIEENLYSDFVILASQIALQIKKVLLFKEVEELSVTDSLTGLYLRRYFEERLDDELQRSKNYNIEFSIIMIDLDNFKECNDTYGHLVGDVVLKELGIIMKKNLREIDLISRYGGEEFCVLLPDTKKEKACFIGERLRHLIENHSIRAYDETIKLTVSIGISGYPHNGATRAKLLESADRALYVAKKQGKNRICVL